MGAFIDLTGRKFGKLTVLERAENKGTRTMWLCKCECGNLTTVNSYELTREHTKSCGCLKIEKPAHLKHGKRHTRIYAVWGSMKKRCYNTHDRAYSLYGGRGITVCDEWLNDFQAFYEWAMNNGYAENLTLDRLDNNKGYSPDNCRWVDMKTQSNNRRSNHYVCYNGETYTIAELAAKYNINYEKLKQRLIKLHWTIERALNTP